MKLNLRGALTVDIHSHGVDGRQAQAVLSLAVVPPALVATNVFDPQSFALQRVVTMTIRGSARCLRPTDLPRTEQEG